MTMLTSTATPTWTMPEIAIFVYLCGELCIQLWSQHRLKKQEQLYNFPSLSLFYRVPFLLSSGGSLRDWLCTSLCSQLCGKLLLKRSTRVLCAYGASFRNAWIASFSAICAAFRGCAAGCKAGGIRVCAEEQVTRSRSVSHQTQAWPIVSETGCAKLSKALPDMSRWAKSVTLPV